MKCANETVTIELKNSMLLFTQSKHLTDGGQTAVIRAHDHSYFV